MRARVHISTQTARIIIRLIVKIIKTNTVNKKRSVKDLVWELSLNIYSVFHNDFLLFLVSSLFNVIHGLGCCTDSGFEEINEIVFVSNVSNANLSTHS